MNKLFAVVAATAAIAACTSPDAPKTSMRGVSVTSNSIVGGTVVSDFSFPYVPFIYNDNQGYLCTGTLIDDFVVLTAAHCVEDAVASHYTICGGDDPFDANGGCYYLTGAAEVHVHPSYDPGVVGAYDIGIIILDAEPAQEDSTGTTQPIPYLASDNGSVYDSSPGTQFTAVGFGITSGTGADDSGIKRTVQLTMNQIYLDIFEYGSATKNTCSGDSGGPALVTIDGKPTVVGVVSYGDQNCQQFGGDSRTDYFSDYIGQFAGAGATPTPTPGSGDDDDDDGTTPGDDDDDKDGNAADDPFGEVGCSIASVTTSPASGVLMLLGVLAFASRRRRT